MDNSVCKFVVTSAYFPYDLCVRRLTLEKILLVYDHSPLVTNLLSSHHHKLLLNWKQVVGNKGDNVSVGGGEISGERKLSQLTTLKRERVDDVEF